MLASTTADLAASVCLSAGALALLMLFMARRSRRLSGKSFQVLVRLVILTAAASTIGLVVWKSVSERTDWIRAALLGICAIVLGALSLRLSRVQPQDPKNID
ncbi:MAG: hypothetical protein R3B70_30830 [Polyangiaceae bacterium]